MTHLLAADRCLTRITGVLAALALFAALVRVRPAWGVLAILTGVALGWAGRRAWRWRQERTYWAWRRSR